MSNLITNLYTKYSIWRRKKFIMAFNKVSTVMYILREKESIEEEFEVNIKAEYQEPEKSYFNWKTGEGHSGSGAEINIFEVTRTDTGATVTLTAAEEEAAREQIIEEINDSEDDYPDDMDDDNDNDREFDD